MVSQWFSGAKEMFEAAREAALDMERARRQLEMLECAGHADLGVRIRSGSISDPMRRVDGIIDRSRVLDARMERDAELVDYACSVIYGREQDGRGGVCMLLGPLHADVLWWRYPGTATWEQVGAAVGYSRTRCKELAAEAIDLCDAYGPDAVLDGRGLAT